MGINLKLYWALAIETMAGYAILRSHLFIQQILIEHQWCDKHKPRVLESVGVLQGWRFQLCLSECSVLCILIKPGPAYCPRIPLDQVLWTVTIVIPRAQEADLCRCRRSSHPTQGSEGAMAFWSFFSWGTSWERGEDAGKGLLQRSPPSKECTASYFPSYLPDHLYRNCRSLTHLQFSIWFLPSPCLQLWFDSSCLDFGAPCSLSLEFNFEQYQFY